MKNQMICFGNNKEQSYLLTKTISEKTSDMILTVLIVTTFSIGNISVKTVLLVLKKQTKFEC